MIVVEGAIRREGGTDLDAETMSAADVMRSLAIFKQMETRFNADAAATSEAATQAPPENVARLNPPNSRRTDQAGD